MDGRERERERGRRGENFASLPFTDGLCWPSPRFPIESANFLINRRGICGKKEWPYFQQQHHHISPLALSSFLTLFAPEKKSPSPFFLLIEETIPLNSLPPSGGSSDRRPTSWRTRTGRPGGSEGSKRTHQSPSAILDRVIPPHRSRRPSSSNLALVFRSLAAVPSLVQKWKISTKFMPKPRKRRRRRKGRQEKMNSFGSFLLLLLLLLSSQQRLGKRRRRYEQRRLRRFDFDSFPLLRNSRVVHSARASE